MLKPAFRSTHMYSLFNVSVLFFLYTLLLHADQELLRISNKSRKLLGPEAYQIREVFWLELLNVVHSHLARIQCQWLQILQLLQMLQPCIGYTRVGNTQRDQRSQPCITWESMRKKGNIGRIVSMYGYENTETQATG